MSGCTETGKPRIAILMAVYDPRMDWLREQLLSLNDQTYPNLMLYVRDDCSPTVPYEEIQKCVRECITNFPYVMTRNERNLGSNLTFQQLTQEAEGTYFAYCDQDDIWLPEKLTVLEEEIRKNGTLLVCSDMYVIDGGGKQVADSITKVRRRQRLLSGDNLAEGLLFHNFVTGCTMLVSAVEAKAAVPFCPYMVHDQYLALWCAERGSIISVMQPWIRYRIHGGNQTGILAGVTDKKSYYQTRIIGTIQKMEWLNDHMSETDEITVEKLQDGLKWAKARKQHWNHQGGLFTICKLYRFGPLTTLFETVANYLPNQAFQWVIRIRKRMSM